MRYPFIAAVLAAVISITALPSCGKLETVRDMQSFQGEDDDMISFSWKLDSRAENVLQSSYRITVAPTMDDLRRGTNLAWDSGRVDSGNSVHVPYSGARLLSGSRYFWNVTVWTEDGRSVSGRAEQLFAPLREWSAAWIGLDGEIKLDEKKRTTLPARYLRKEFELSGKVESALLYICGLGSSECFINGSRVGDDVFGALPTWYTKSVQYQTYDVTDMLRSGRNAVGVILGNGRYVGVRMQKKYHFGLPRMIAQLEVTYRDGRRETIVSDTSWTATDKGPVTANNEFDGEVCDARLDLGEWDRTGYVEDSRWTSAIIMDAPGGVLRAQMSPGLKVHETLAPSSVRMTEDGRVIVDMGQNMVGRLQVRLRGRSGSRITMRFAEVLQDDCPDSLYVANLRSSVVKDEYVPASDGVFSWCPQFVYHGFRFVEVSGLDYTPSASDFKGQVIYDGMPTTGTFESSDEVLNAIHRNAYWGIRGNYRGMPTDCPQRDERQGWLGDRATGCYGESFIFGNERLYNKWLLDIEECQEEDGCMPNVAPAYWNNFSPNVTWPLVFITGADMLRTRFGNDEAICRRYPAMRKWLKYIRENMMEGNLVVKDRYGDWCMPPESLELIHSKDPSRITSATVLSTTNFYFILGKMQEYAQIAGHPEDVEEYRSLAAAVKEEYNGRFFNADIAGYDNNTVTANLLSLRLGLVPDGYEEKVAANIVKTTQEVWGGHVSGGVLGIQHMMRGLSEYGYQDLAFQIASADTYPSWGYMIRCGATTIWELWNGNTADPAMNSRNHVMLLGDLIVWFYEYLAGIRNAEGSVAFKEIDFKPCLPSGLDFVNASYESAYGRIVSNWKKNDGHFEWHIEIPANTTATVNLPDGTVSKIGSGSHDFSTDIL